MLSLGNGLTNVQCRSRYNHLIKQGKVSIDEAEYMAAANTSDPGYVYDDEIEVAFKNQIKILPRKSRVWSPEMVCFVYHCCMSILHSSSHQF